MFWPGVFFSDGDERCEWMEKREAVLSAGPVKADLSVAIPDLWGCLFLCPAAVFLAQGSLLLIPTALDFCLGKSEVLHVFLPKSRGRSA